MIHNIESLDLEYKTPAQPMNEGTTKACFTRLMTGVKHLQTTGQLEMNDRIFAIENGVPYRSRIVRCMCSDDL